MKYFEGFLFSFISISLHEMVHVMTALIFGIRVKTIRILPVGLNAVIEEEANGIWKMVAVYLSGPTANVLLYILGIIFYKNISDIANISIYRENIIYKESIKSFANVNLYLAIFNILPVIPLDGSRILIKLLSLKKGLIITNKYIKRLSLAFSIVFILIGFVQIFFSSFFNLSLIIIGIYIIILIISKDMEESFMNMKQILFRRSRLLKKGIYPVRELAVMKNMALGDILKNLDFDRFHMIYVLDEKFKVLHMYTEQEIIDGIINYNSDITFEEFVEKL